MNSLSIVLYLAGVAGALKSLFGVLAVFCGISMAIAACIGVGALIQEDEDVAKAIRLFLSKWWVVASFALGASLIPSQETIYLIAASEVGEVVATSDEGNAILGELQAAIRKQLKQLAEK